MSIRTLIRRFIEPLVSTAFAHCDTADGPAVTDGHRALDTGNINHALKWIQASDEAELREVFDMALAVRSLGPQAAEVADRLFLETLVRLHRMAEGVGFTGIQPTGTKIDPLVAAADRALETGDDSQVSVLAPSERRAELHRRFQIALGKRKFEVNDVTAGRDYVAAYVNYFKYAEGDAHEHHHAKGDNASAQHETAHSH
jgi:hypothetical protein